MRVKRYFAPHLIHELLRCYASLRFAPVGAEQTSTGCLAPRNSTHIRNPLIFQGKSQGHQSKIDDSPHVCAGQQVRALILQAGTSSDLLTLVSYILYPKFIHFSIISDLQNNKKTAAPNRVRQPLTALLNPKFKFYFQNVTKLSPGTFLI